MALRDQIWREDVKDELEIVVSSTKVLHDWVRRLTYQQAPPELIARISALRDKSAELSDELAASVPCFPPQPRED
jgi:hypothetical protein